MALSGDDLGDALAECMFAQWIRHGSWPTDEIKTATRSNMREWAQVIVDYLVANAEIRVTIKPSDVGLQRDPESGEPTQGPAANVVLTGTLE